MSFQFRVVRIGLFSKHSDISLEDSPHGRGVGPVVLQGHLGGSAWGSEDGASSAHLGWQWLSQGQHPRMRGQDQL